MNYAEKERATLGFTPYEGSGSVEETFYPWNLTAERFVEEGISRELTDRALYYKDPADSSLDEQKKMYFVVNGSRGVMEYEHSLGFDPVLRIGFNLPFCRTVPEVLGETEGTLTRRNVLGKIVCRDKSSGLEREIHNPVESQEDWEALKEYGKRQLELLYTDEILEEVYGPFVNAHEAGDYSLRLNIEGFFWVPRELLGIEEHLFVFYDEPELIHDMCQSILEIYTTKLLKVIDMLKPDVLYISEDLSGANGPMISPAFFDEFIASYYKQLIPLLKQHGVGLVFVDTDGDFNALIHYMKLCCLRAKADKRTSHHRETFFCKTLVGTKGLEPLQYHYWQILSLLRLPIPPRPHALSS